MTTHVTTRPVRTRLGEVRNLQILRHTHPDPRRQTQQSTHEEFLLDGAPVEPAGEGRFRVISTGEILRAITAPD